MTTITGFMRLVKTDPVLKVPNSEVFEPYLGNEVEFRKSEKTSGDARLRKVCAKFQLNRFIVAVFQAYHGKKQVKGL